MILDVINRHLQLRHYQAHNSVLSESLPLRIAMLLMCPPDYFGIEYEINPWMSVEIAADHGLAQDQWRGLHSLLSATGIDIQLLTPTEGLPDLVFTANAGLVFGRKVLVSRFRHPQRQGEEPVFRDWFASHGFEIVDFAPSSAGGGSDFEGAGDALFCGDTLFAGYRMRSDATCHQQIGSILGVRVIPVELVDPRYYHLDTCFCPLAADEAIWYPPAFDEYGRRRHSGDDSQVDRGRPYRGGTVRLQRRGRWTKCVHQCRLSTTARSIAGQSLRTD